MKVLLLGPYRQRLIDFFASQGDSVQWFEERISIEMKIVQESDWLISYGYRYLICREVLEKFKNNAINLHISYLPWNRGADPNLWSFLEDTPKGVTIHLIAPTLDTGDIVVQRTVDFGNTDTLRTSYDKLTVEIEDLLKNIWSSLKQGLIQPQMQPTGGSFHKMIDKDRYMPLLSKGWDTPLHCLRGKAL
jgi:methionyl-tRNA formyltransferase